MNIEDLAIGTKITLLGNREFRIVDIRKEDNRDYFVCTTNQKPILPIVFEYRINDNKIQVRQEQNDKVLQSIYDKMIKENS